MQASVEARFRAPPADCSIVFKERLPGVYFLRDALFSEGVEVEGDAGEEEVYG